MTSQIVTQLLHLQLQFFQGTIFFTIDSTRMSKLSSILSANQYTKREKEANQKNEVAIYLQDILILIFNLHVDTLKNTQ